MRTKERSSWERKGPPKKLMRFITSLQAIIYKGFQREYLEHYKRL